MTPLPRRIVVTGTTGSGKTTVARRLSRALAIPHVELDALWWEPGWHEAEPDIFRRRVADAVADDAWVVDGNYRTQTAEITWARAELLVWLDYPLRTVLRQLLLRTLRRAVTGEQLWNGNTERQKLLDQFRPGRSLFAWALKTHVTNRKITAALLRDPRFAHLRPVRLRTPAESDRWLASFAPQAAAAPAT
jgi:adenylate kinase family enzyme